VLELTRIELENFGPFFDSHDQELKNKKNKKMILFSGSTGSGKTSLNEAIEWCLFGSSNNKRNMFNLINDLAKVNCKKDHKINSKVILTFNKDSKGISEKIILIRNVSIKRTNRSILKGIETTDISDFEFEETGREFEFFEVHKWEGVTQKPITISENTFREIYFPDIVKDYYIIYGESIVNPHVKEKIKIAVERNCFAEIFDKVQENLNNLKNKIIHLNQKESKKKENLQKEITEKNIISKRIKELQEENSNKEKQKITISDALSELDKKLGKNSESAKQLKIRRTSFELKAKELQKNISLKEQEVLGDGFRLLINIYSNSSQKKLFKYLEQKIKRGEMPEKIKTAFINSLLKESRCICKRDLNSDEKSILVKLRDENVIGENYENLMNTKFCLNSEIDGLKDSISRYGYKVTSIEKLVEKKNQKEKEIKNISDELASMHGIAKLEKERAQNKSGKDILESEISKNKDKLYELRKDEKKKQTIIERYAPSNEPGATSIIEFINSLYVSIKKSKDSVIDSTRKDIEESTSKLYKTIVSNAIEGMNDIDKVELDSEYAVKVIMKKGDNYYAKTKFSTGEQLVFAISFLSALRKHSGYGGPIFLDSPFSVLDPKYRREVAINIAKKIPGQLIIFTREDTFNDLGKIMEGHVSEIINIKKESEWMSKFEENK
jgi:DNA sulfur modification protein DndD